MKSHIPTIILGVIAVILYILGFLFKIQHWPYGSDLMLFGNIAIVLAALYAIILAIFKKKN